MDSVWQQNISYLEAAAGTSIKPKGHFFFLFYL